MTTEGIYAKELGCYIVIERTQGRICRICLSNQPADDHSAAAEQILNHILGRGPVGLDLDFSGFTEFQMEVYRTVCAIPRGQTMTYGQVAELSGHPGAARAVGRAMATNPYILVMPCHRVVASHGLGGYGYGLEMKEKILALERT
ncbi:MAG TPA: MGMT family protein [Methanotrichaceae archaeon]|nr:MGMT family protein [Methanotrichaceae archaeon]